MENLKIQGTEIVGASNTRISKTERNNNLHYYDVRHDDDCKGDAVMLSPFVMINYWGTIITKQPFNFHGDTCLYLSETEGETVNEALAKLHA